MGIWPFARRETPDGQLVISPLPSTPGIPSGSSGFVASRPSSQQENNHSDTDELQEQDLEGNWFNSRTRNCSLQPPRSLSFDSLVAPTHNQPCPGDQPLFSDRHTGFTRNSSTPILSNANNSQAIDSAKEGETPETGSRSLPQPSYQLHEPPPEHVLRRSKSIKNAQASAHGKNKLHRRHSKTTATSGNRNRAINNPKKAYPTTKGDHPLTASDDTAAKREATFKINALNALFPHPQLVYQNQIGPADLSNPKLRAKDKQQKPSVGKENKPPSLESKTKPQSSQPLRSTSKQRPTTHSGARSKNGKDLPDTMSAATLRELLEKDQRRREIKRQNGVPRAASKTNLQGSTPDRKLRSAAGANSTDAARRKKLASQGLHTDDNARNKRSARDADTTPRKPNRERRATATSLVSPQSALASGHGHNSDFQGVSEFLIPPMELHRRQDPARPSSASSPFIHKSSPLSLLYSGLSQSRSAGQINQTHFGEAISKQDPSHSTLVPPHGQTRVSPTGQNSYLTPGTATSISTPVASPDIDGSHKQSSHLNKTPTAMGNTDDGAVDDPANETSSRRSALGRSQGPEHFSTLFSCDDDTSVLSRQDSVTSSFYSEADDIGMSRGDANDSAVTITVRPGAGRKGHVVRTLEADGILSNAVEPELEVGDEDDDDDEDDASVSDER